MAYFSDASGEYALHVAPQNGRGEPRRYELDGSGFYHNPRWSPDSKKISYWDNSLTVYWIDLESGAVEKVDAEYRYSPIRFFHHRCAGLEVDHLHARHQGLRSEGLRLFPRGKKEL